MEAGQGLTGRRVALLFDDGEKVTRREGTVTRDQLDFIFLDGREGIARGRIIRIEIFGGGMR